MKINKNSWHFWLIKKLDSYYHYQLSRWPEETDSCEYIRKVIFLLFIAVLIAFVSSSVAVIVVISEASFISWLLFMFNHGYIEPIPDTVVAAIINFLLSMSLIGHIRNKMPKSTTPGFFSQAYARYKDKFCTKLEIN